MRARCYLLEGKKQPTTTFDSLHRATPSLFYAPRPLLGAGTVLRFKGVRGQRSNDQGKQQMSARPLLAHATSSSRHSLPGERRATVLLTPVCSLTTSNSPLSTVKTDEPGSP